MRLLLIAVLLVVAGVAGMLAWGALDNLFRDYRDSPTSTYLLYGIPALVVALGALYGAGRIWRSR